MVVGVLVTVGVRVIVGVSVVVGVLVTVGVSVLVGVDVRVMKPSKAPMSQRTPCGRVTPRWSSGTGVDTVAVGVADPGGTERHLVEGHGVDRELLSSSGTVCVAPP